LIGGCSMLKSFKDLLRSETEFSGDSGKRVSDDVDLLVRDPAVGDACAYADLHADSMKLAFELILRRCLAHWLVVVL
jgi:hypothetical protein